MADRVWHTSVSKNWKPVMSSYLILSHLCKATRISSTITIQWNNKSECFIEKQNIRFTSLMRPMTICPHFNCSRLLLFHTLLSFNLIIIRSKRELSCKIQWMRFCTDWPILLRTSLAPVPPTNNWERSNNQNHKKSKMKIKLKRRNGSTSVILRVSLTPHCIIPSALFIQTASMNHPTRKKGNTHLQKPRPVQNQPNPSSQSRQIRFWRFQFKNRREKTNCDRNKHHIKVTVFDSNCVLSLKVKQQKLFRKGEKTD